MVPAALIGSISCGNSGYRLYNEFNDPTVNDDLDHQFRYQAAVAFMDAVGLIGATTATHATIKLVRHLKNTTGQTMLQVLKGLTRQQRKQFAEEAVRLANPRTSGQQLKMFVRAGTFPKRDTPFQISHTVTRQIKEALGAAAGFVGSAFDGLINKGVQAVKEAAHPSSPRKQTDYGNYVVGLAYSFETF
ncbi:MAG: synthetase [Myxococcaceae bacterium]|nr:synthetase [Myxococcaceae bacterium]